MNDEAYNDEPAVAQFTDYYVANLADIAEGALFIPLNDEDYSATQDALAGIGG